MRVKSLARGAEKKRGQRRRKGDRLLFKKPDNDKRY